MAKISVLILTYNERVHIARCVANARELGEEVFVVDSFSDDGTPELARSLGAHVVQHAWENHHARQINWAIDNLPFTGDWIFRLDADEWLTPELIQELRQRLDHVASDVNGIVLRRRLYAFGKWLRWGGQDQVYLLRLWRRGLARCEERWMDEHMVLASGRTQTFQNDFADENEKPLSWWIVKHAGYAVREVADTLLDRRRAEAAQTLPQDAADRRKRWLKWLLYSGVPRFVRPTLYFGYRYVGRLGFLDGVPGLTWHVLQAFWYRFLIDAILYDVERRAKLEGVDPLTVLERTYGLKAR